MRNHLVVVALLLLAVPWLLPASDAVLTGDTYIRSSASTANYGGASALVVNSQSRALLQFDLSTLPAGTTASGVAKATLKLWVSQPCRPDFDIYGLWAYWTLNPCDPGPAPAGSFDVRRITSGWSEGTVMGQTAPAIGSAVASAVPAGGANLFVAVDVTPAVKEWLSGTANHGLALVANAAGTQVQFDSKESTQSSHPAELEIALAGPQGPAGPTGPQGAPGLPGVPGAKGPQGNPGPAGATGARGTTGAAGGTGPVGVVGPTGAAGPTGVAGAIGAQGATGAIGVTGPVGATGLTGAVGPIGSAGPTGATGATGAKGPTGQDGAEGSTGATGATGPHLVTTIFVHPGFTNGQPDAVKSGTALVSARNTACNSASASQHYVLKIEPGTYNVVTPTTDDLGLCPYVDFEGSGEDITTITGSKVYTVTAFSTNVALGEVRCLTIINTQHSNNDGGTPVYFNSGNSWSLRHVTVVTDDSYAYAVDSFGSGIMDHVTLVSSGIGLHAEGPGTVQVLESSITSSAIGIRFYENGYVRNTAINASTPIRVVSGVTEVHGSSLWNTNGGTSSLILDPGATATVYVSVFGGGVVQNSGSTVACYFTTGPSGPVDSSCQ